MPILSLFLSLLVVVGGLAAADAPVPGPDVSATAPAPAAPPLRGDPRYNRPRFIAVPQDGRLYVFHAGAKELQVFAQTHVLNHSCLRNGGVVDGMIVIAPSEDTLNGYLAIYAATAKAAAGAGSTAAPAPGVDGSSTAPAPAPLRGDPRYNRPRFIAVPQDGRLYVFHAGAKELQKFTQTHMLEHGCLRNGGVVDGMIVIAPSEDTLNGYLALYSGTAAASAGSAVTTGAAPSATVEKPSTGASKSP